MDLYKGARGVKAEDTWREKEGVGKVEGSNRETEMKREGIVRRRDRGRERVRERQRKLTNMGVRDIKHEKPERGEREKMREQ